MQDKQSETQRFIEGLITHRQEPYEPEPFVKTFSIRMSEFDHTLLANLAGYFGRKKTPLAEAFLGLAMRDAAKIIAESLSNGDPEKAEEIYRKFFDPQGIEPGVDTLVSSEKA